MVDQIMAGGDERTGKVEEVQICEAKGDCSRMGERSERSNFLNGNRINSKHAHRDIVRSGLQGALRTRGRRAIALLCGAH
jgi:hypothetical protein